MCPITDNFNITCAKTEFIFVTIRRYEKEKERNREESRKVPLLLNKK